MDEPFAHLLRRFRTRAGLTISELALALGAARDSIRAWEQGRRVPRDRARLADLAQVLQLSSTEATTLAAAARSQPGPGMALALQTEMEAEATTSSTLPGTSIAAGLISQRQLIEHIYVFRKARVNFQSLFIIFNGFIILFIVIKEFVGD